MSGSKLCPFCGKVQGLSSLLGLLWPFNRLFGRAEALDLRERQTMGFHHV